MRAWQLNDLGEPAEVLHLNEVADPTPGDGQVVLDIKAASIGFPDLLQVRGGYQVKPPMPFTPGTEIAGVVSAVGGGVSNVSEGDRVLWMGLGGLADKVVAPAAACFPIPDGMTEAQASVLLINYGTGVFALENRAKLQPGETLLVTAAAGGAGSAAVQLGKAMGANVIGLAGGAKKVETVYSLGADAAFDYNEVDIVDAVRAATDNRGVDVCYEAVGGDTFQQVRRTMGWDGRLLIIGFTSGKIADAPTNHMLLKNYSVVGVHWGAWLARDRANLRANWDRICELFETGKIDPLISAERPLEEAVDAFTALGSRGTVGKVVICP